jgi:ArsR family transcriptional regulator
VVADMTKPIDPDIQLLAALADPTRLEILRELAGTSQICACDLTDCCNVSQPTVSHHLKVLREAGAVVSERSGSNIYYSVAPNLTERLGVIAQTLIPGGLIPLGSVVPASKAKARSGARSSATAAN